MSWNRESIEWCVEEIIDKARSRYENALAWQRILDEDGIDAYAKTRVNYLLYAPVERDDPKFWEGRAEELATYVGALRGINCGELRGIEVKKEACRFGRTATKRDAPWLYDDDLCG